MFHSVSTTYCGLMTSLLVRRTSGSRLLAPSVDLCPPGRQRRRVGPRGASLIMAISSGSTSLTSPTIGMSTFTRLEMRDGSMSMWMILRSFWAKCFGLPITRSSKRAPTASSTSQFCIALLASLVPCMPSMPRNLRSLAGIGAQAHQRVGARDSRACRPARAARRGVAEHHAAAGVDVGPLGRQQQLQRLADLPAVALAHRVVRAHLDLVRVAV